ncbi:response regulator [Undibacterium sp. Di24W]|uniref:response regulator n=1 Tax=Undibacterium sp. Di24W TaxID=3413033 RepID=UPI003BF081A0
MLPRILMIEDDQRLANMVSTYLQQNGYQVVHAGTAREGIELLNQQSERDRFSVLLLDLMLPDAFGLDVCKQIRAQQDVNAIIPIIMLTAKGDPMDRVVGLEIGADDYLAKPFEPRELLARLRSTLRRQEIISKQLPQQSASASTSTTAQLNFGNINIDLDARSLKVSGEEYSITGYQFDLLVVMAQHAGRVLSRDFLLDAVKGEALHAFDRSIDVHIGRLRAAIEVDPKQPKRIITVRGAGYVFSKAQDV